MYVFQTEPAKTYVLINRAKKIFFSWLKQELSNILISENTTLIELVLKVIDKVNREESDLFFTF